jgi:hypothetical protein
MVNYVSPHLFDRSHKSEFINTQTNRLSKDFESAGELVSENILSSAIIATAVCAARRRRIAYPSQGTVNQTFRHLITPTISTESHFASSSQQIKKQFDESAKPRKRWKKAADFIEDCEARSPHLKKAIKDGVIITTGTTVVVGVGRTVSRRQSELATKGDLDRKVEEKNRICVVKLKQSIKN